MWLKFIKFIIALVLLPFCFGGISTFWFLIQAVGSADVVWVPLLAGFACWLVIYAFMPKPMLVYVFGHELTHAFWTWIFGGRVRRFRATSKGGHIVVDKENFLIFLAPYFFPIYAIILFAFFALGNLFLELEKYRSIFYLLLGAAYGFHLTFTLQVLHAKQPDIVKQGLLFSMVIIFLGNILVLAIGLPILCGFSIVTTLKFWLISTFNLYGWILNWVGI